MIMLRTVDTQPLLVVSAVLDLHWKKLTTHVPVRQPPLKIVESIRKARRHTSRENEVIRTLAVPMCPFISCQLVFFIVVERFRFELTFTA